ncbi:MAG: magnesium transporter [Planctomycetes bacterium]|nr:magnesium transporter [Planctomycetota bacterium]
MPSLDSSRLRERLEELLAPEQAPALSEYVRATRAEDIAEALRNFSDDEKVRIFDALDDGQRAVVIYETDEASQEALTRLLPDRRLAEVLVGLRADQVADLVEDHGESEREALLSRLPLESAGEVRELLRYAPETAGGIMSPEFISVSSSATAREVLVVLQEIVDTEVVSYIYVVDADERLQGVVSIREILRAAPSDAVADFMQREVITAHVDDDQEAVANLARKYNLNSIPIVDDQRRILGIATIDDLIDILSEEVDEDFSRIAGTETGYTSPQPVLRRALARIPWLLLPGMSGLVVATFFEEGERQHVVLWSFLPLVMGISGASGTQASTILVRGMATGEIDAARRLKVLIQEALVGLSVAFTVGTVAGTAIGAAALVGWFELDRLVPLAVSLGVVTGVGIATMAGVSLPFFFRFAKIDPALAAGPFITSLIDVLAALAFLTIGKVVLG